MMQELGNRYQRDGHEVHHIIPGPLTQDVIFNGVHVHSIKSPTIPFSGGYRMIWNTRLVRSLMEAVQPDFVEISDRCTLIPAGSHARKLGASSVAFAHERLDGVIKAHLQWLPAKLTADVLNRWAAKHVDRFVATTTYASEELARLDIPYDKIPLGVDLELFHPRLREYSNHSVKRIVLCSRLSREKRCDFAIEVVRDLVMNGHSVQMFIIGDGPLRQELEAQAANLPVRFLGFIQQREEVAAHLANADVVLAPGPIETFGLAALESLATGTPVVVNSESALPEVVGEAGWAEPLDVAHWREALEEIFSSPESVVRASARSRAETFSWDNCADSLVRLHNSLLNKVVAQ